MPVPTIAAARAAGSGLKANEHLMIVGVIVVAGLALLWAGMRATGGGIKVPARSTEDVPPFVPPPGQPVVGPDLHMGGVVWSPHRYPHVTGHEISALINYGHATLRLPHSRDIDWLTCPPSEVDL